ncbi:pentapeptide repeat-containing protein [Kribbella sp. NPDC006257]|uniref:pentapeptide repeat-containing protein n=1 Tax=Kribbella sp. NPDC006257 TaxID=3156738 RepID=UPI0033BBE33B
MRSLRIIQAFYPFVWAAPAVVVLILAVVSETWGLIAASIVLGLVATLALGWVLGAGISSTPPNPTEGAPPLATVGEATTDASCASDASDGKAVLTGADLTGADLTGADLRGLDLRTVNLTRAVLRDANLRGARLSDGTDSK